MTDGAYVTEDAYVKNSSIFSTFDVYVKNSGIFLPFVKIFNYFGSFGKTFAKADSKKKATYFRTTFGRWQCPTFNFREIPKLFGKRKALVVVVGKWSLYRRLSFSQVCL